MERNRSVILTLLILNFFASPSVVVSSNQAISSSSSVVMSSSLATADQSTPVLPSVSSVLVSSSIQGNISSFMSIIGAATSLAPTPTARTQVLPSSSVCPFGKILTGLSGYFSSHNLPNDYVYQGSGCISKPYPDKCRRTWNITVPSGYIIKIRFLYFDLQYRWDILGQLNITNIYPGSVTFTGGFSPPDPVYSVGNSIQVAFVSYRSSFPCSAFNAFYTAITYESVCPNLMSLNETSGVITSPYYPRQYGDNQTCSWKITATKGNYIVFIITSMYIKQCGAACTCDYLEIQNGLSSDGVSSARRCGHLNGVIYHVFNDSLKVLFVSDHAGKSRGFNATYIQVNYTGLPAACISGESLTGSSGFFASPNFPNNYPQYSRCTWNIKVPSGNIIKISFLRLQLGYSWRGGARLTITNVSSGTVTLYGTSHSDPVYSVGNSIQVTFISLAGQYLGFNASYTAITYESVCPNLMYLNETSGVITSPYYPRPYSDNQTCSWQITPTKGNYIVLTIEAMNIQQCGEACTCGYLEIQNGLSSDFASNTRRCGNLRNVIHHSYNDSLKVLFVSGRAVGGWHRGFKATYTQVNYTGLPAACISGESLTGSSGFFSSPNFPNNYPQYSRCTWNITVPSGHIIKISFLRFQLGYSWRDGAQLSITNSSSSHVTLDGDSLPDPVYVIRNSIQVTFISRTGQYSGFNASYTAINYESACTSEEILNGSSGFFSSPNFPKKYLPHNKCTWNITVPSGYIIKVRFLHFRLDPYPYDDHVTITNVASSGGRLDGRQFPAPVYSLGNSIQVTFISHANEYSGFNASYTAITNESVCPNLMTLNDASGVITSPYYPRPYGNNHACIWHITASKGKRVKLVIEEMGFYPPCRQACTCDYLEIQNGSFSSDAVPAGKMCGYLMDNVTFYSFHETLKVLFISRQSVFRQNNGFIATYTQLNGTASSECSNYRFLDESNRARSYSGIINLCDTTLSGWYRFSGAAGSQIAESCVDKGYCGTDAPGWLNGSHPAVADGAVQRRVCFNHFDNCCSYSTYISVRNCGVFYVYKLERPPQCSLRYCGNGLSMAPECYNYRLLNESNRARTFFHRYYSLSDRTLSTGWYRFSGGAGSQMAESCVSKDHCGTSSPGWLSGSHPAVDDGTVQRRVCFNHHVSCCYVSIYISVRNCGGFYVYKLKPVTWSRLRYCGNGFVPPTLVTPVTVKKLSSTTEKTTATTPKTLPPTTAHLPTLSPLSFAETEAVVQLVNRKTLSNGNPVRYFQIIVILLNKGTDPGNPADKKYQRIKRKYEDQVDGKPYITAEFSKDETRTTFTVGDGKYYSQSGVTKAVTKYLNGKLKSNTQYAVFQRSFDEDGGYENEGFVRFTTKATEFPTAIVVSVVVVLLVLLILAGGFIVWRRSQHVIHNVTKTSSRNLQHCSTQEMEMTANINPSKGPSYGRLL